MDVAKAKRILKNLKLELKMHLDLDVLAISTMMTTTSTLHAASRI